MSEERIVSMSLDEVRQAIARGDDLTDWERLENLTDEEIAQAIEDDPDAAPILDAEWFRAARWVVPSAAKEKISIRLDEHVLAFFRAGGTGYQSRINEVLRAYVLTQRLRRDSSGPGEAEEQAG